MPKIALFPGSFDPITRGHEALIRKALPLFDKIIVVIGDNTRKHTMFPLEQRLLWVRQTFADTPQIEVACHHGLTVDYCHEVGARSIIRGVRNGIDFGYEQEIARINKEIAPDVESVFLLPDAGTEVVSSTMVRELLTFGKDVTPYIPAAIHIER